MRNNLIKKIIVIVIIVIIVIVIVVIVIVIVVVLNYAKIGARIRPSPSQITALS